MTITHRVLPLVLLLVLAAAVTAWRPVAAQASAAHDLAAEPALAAATQAYRAGDFGRAHALYASALAAGGAPRGLVLFHLGNSAYRLGNRAEALWHYRRALVRLPRDGELQANVRLVEHQLGVDPPPASLAAALLAPLDALGRAGLLALTTALQTVGLVGLALLHDRRQRIAMAVLAVLGVGGALRAAWLHWGAGPAAAVVLGERVELRAAPDAASPSLLTLRPGEALQLDAADGRWLAVTHALGSGFIESASAGIVD